MVRKHTKITRKRNTRSRKSMRRLLRRVYRGGVNKEYVAEMICNAAKEGDRLEKLKPILDAFNIIPSYYVDKTNVKDHPMYTKFSEKATNSERSLTINHVMNLQKNKDTGKFVLMFESDVKPLMDIQTLTNDIDKTVKEMKEKDIGIVFLGKGHLNTVDTSKYEKISDTLYKTDESRCTEAYIISPKCIHMYLDYFNTTNENVTPDWNFNHFFKATPHVIACWRIPELFEQDKGFPTLLNDRA
jgi:hypothetical protein